MRIAAQSRQGCGFICQGNIDRVVENNGRFFSRVDGPAEYIDLPISIWIKREPPSHGAPQRGIVMVQWQPDFS